MKATTVTSQLIRDLWNFIENVTDDDPERTDKFFALRERVREFYGSEGQKQHKKKS
jgi:hypothetical protein